MGTDQPSERDLLRRLFCALWGQHGIDGRHTRFWRDGIEGFIEVVFTVKVKCKGRHGESSDRREDTAAILGLEFF
jgi:hypothetical protein